ncbi:MAG: hypothetical protein Q8R28_07480, partial [Dehalococcoidia bacterium]|nr:hypothetical protein [Dehalococcoidia bacterium]
LTAGARYVDLEAGYPLQGLPPSRVIRSRHLSDDQPASRRRALQDLLAAPGALVKWVAPVAESRDLCDEEKILLSSPRPALVIHGGSGGAWTRACPPGLDWSYVAQDDGPETGPGQYRLKEHCQLGGLPLYGLLGWPVAHSLSPLVHNALRRRRGLPGSYVPVPCRRLEGLLEGLGRRFAGFSVTAPHKIQALALADTPDAIARATGAANTLRRCASGWEATNTDATALRDLLQDKGIGPGTTCTIVGGGGFARAALWATRELGADRSLVVRRPKASATLAATFDADLVALSSWHPGNEDVLIQATSDPAAIAQRGQPDPHTWLVEAVYASESPWTRNHKRLISSRRIFAAQAAAQASYWLGETISRDEVEALLP